MFSTPPSAHGPAAAAAAAAQHILARTESEDRISVMPTTSTSTCSPTTLTGDTTAPATTGNSSTMTTTTTATPPPPSMQAVYSPSAHQTAMPEAYGTMTTPPTTTTTPSSSANAPAGPGTGTGTTSHPPRQWHRYDQRHIKVLLVEAVSPVAVDELVAAGYQVESVRDALSETDLMARVADVHVVGIRSKTKVTAAVIAAAPRLLAIGCFCIGTNQVDVDAASRRGIAVFNSPYANSRSVAELTVANIVNLARQVGDRNRELHTGVWNKVSRHCYEVRGKTLGIIGYGHIGSQLSVLAEALGMRVVFHDVRQLMPLGSARPMGSLREVVQRADFVSLHVPETPDTINLMGADQLHYMKRGAYLINASRGRVVDLDALAQCLQSGHLGGAAIDVYPTEPTGNGPHFTSSLMNCPNTILTPHIGGSTEEAQRAIGLEVSRAIHAWISEGVSQGSVNLPGLALKPLVPNPLTIRVTNVHRNVPGVLRKVNLLLADFNIERQSSDSVGDIAYMVADVTLDCLHLERQLRTIHEGVAKMDENILVRVFY